ncbi:MAG: hypothetical protein N4A76_13120 [Firmicutes bacterium]|jgi:hypothetical protein|nr:hypothetical protein [Bacillota bacterium]
MKKNIIISIILGVIFFISSTNAGSIFKYISEIVINNGYTQEIIDGVEYNGDIYINVKDISKYGNQNLVYDRSMKTVKIISNNISGQYEGDVSNGLYHGKGKLILDNGDIYEGEFNRGIIHGEGIMYYSDGKKYIGSWVNGRWSGKGKLYWISGKSYIGFFKEGFINGTGTMYFSNGDKYVGEFDHNFKHGRGKYTFENGYHYDGMWDYGLYHGEGILTTGKTRKIGIWSKGQFIERKLLNELTIEIDK